MISRRILPSRTAISLAAMTSRCQFSASSACGFRSAKQRPTKVTKSSRSRVSYSACVKSLIIGLSVIAKEPGLQLFDDLLVRRGEGGDFGGCRFGLGFDVADQVEQDLERAQIGCRRAVDELRDDRFAFRDLATPAILGDDDRLVERFTQ